MKMSILERLLFAQGNRCFFCDQPLNRSEATVEHLVASSNGGSNAEGNCVACCQSLNYLLGSLSLKEKLRVVLNQRGRFRCPARRGSEALPPAIESKNEDEDENQSETSAAIDHGGPGPGRAESLFQAAVLKLAPLKTPPRTLTTLRNHLKALLPTMTPEEQDALIEVLKASGKIVEADRKIEYHLEASGGGSDVSP
ncbi:HNH endonuclease [Aquisphaera insulae]|uniref:HNH endonuclease n=1 Tax=Aquisphaera insulae TaxID=2712864 RepID=UPI00196B98CF|nr:HNH endonuclease signature motif containing protein [Aquisphaera insulae]